LDQVNIRFPARPSFTSYPIPCDTVQFCASPTLLLSGGHTAFPDQRIALFWPGFKTRRILSRVLHEQKTPTLRGNRTVVRCKSQILRYLRLRGGGSRERTILHHRIPSITPIWVQNRSLPVIGQEGVNECIGDLASSLHRLLSTSVASTKRS
jgi:hypothetical protein